MTNFQRKRQICAQCVIQEGALNLDVLLLSAETGVIFQGKAKPDWLFEQSRAEMR